MSGNSVWCLMVSGPGINDRIRDILFDTAQAMAQKGRCREKVKGGDFEGLVTTAGKTVLMGSVAGILFEATIETEETKTSVSYLVRLGDLCSDDGQWFSWNHQPVFDSQNN